MNEKMTRDRFEKLLWEATEFRLDAAQMAALMLAAEAWAIEMAGGLTTASPTLREGHEHLVVQMGELILDSGGRLAATQKLADKVEALTSPREALTGLLGEVQSVNAQLKALTKTVLAREAPRPLPAYEPLPAPREAMVEEVQRTLAAAELAFQEELAATGKIPRKVAEDMMTPQVREEVAAVLHPQTQSTVHCNTCGEDKPVSHFFKNSKSKSGYESKCRTCRSSGRVAA